MPVGKLSIDTLKISRVEDMSRQAKFVVRDPAIREALRGRLEIRKQAAGEGLPALPAD